MQTFNKWMATFTILILVGFYFAFSGSPAARAEISTQAFDAWNVAVTPTADILSTSLSPLTRGKVSTPMSSSVTYRATVGIAPGATSSIVYLRVTNVAAATTLNFALNSGVALTQGNVYTFEWNASQAFTYNFRPDVVTTLGILSIDRKEDPQ